MKTNNPRRRIGLARVTRGIAVPLAALSLAACSGASSDVSTTAAATVAVSPADVSELDSELAAVPSGTLSAADAEGLIWMREEEKLAHDVYVALYDMWGLRIFSNIAEAETTHTEAVESLLDRYGLDDPAAGNDKGVFTNPDIQALYEDLVAQGSESIVAALGVGALIEDLDIVDLQSLQTDVPDIAVLYDNLERGSRNHMRAFVSNLEKRGETYTPIHLSLDEFEAIISSPTERGGPST